MDNLDCCSKDGKICGCMVCGRELVYTTDQPLPATCFYCGKEDVTCVTCEAGHYVCDECHSRGILALVEQECQSSDLSDPVELALRIFAWPQLHMHGPEYHSIVPAVLVAAYGNSVGRKDRSAVKEAIRRGKALLGGICGLDGACGACIGVGIAYSIIHRVTPYSEAERGNALRMTALALTAASRIGGPRCCKRESMLAIETAKQHFGCFAASGSAQYRCRQFAVNDQCRGQGCPYYPLGPGEAGPQSGGEK